MIEFSQLHALLTNSSIKKILRAKRIADYENSCADNDPDHVLFMF
jgi:hypothetical protein